MESISTPTLPPQCMQKDEYTAADAARQRFVYKPRFPLFRSAPNLRASASKPSGMLKHGNLKGKAKGDESGVEDGNTPINALASSDLLPLEQENELLNKITLDDSALPNDPEDRDTYRWAILYENQRGATIFSIPYYSRLSLLPTDPLPFTLPSASPRRRDQPSLSFTTYPLPDGKWRWVSKSWMIDMRSDRGEVQYDGFEYNWRFRKENWRAEVGTFSAGGWVRRRRWVRLMVRPAERKKGKIDGHEHDASSGSTTPISASSYASRASLPPSVLYPGSIKAVSSFDLQAEDVWMGEDPEDDWARCHLLMKRLGRDGRKIELWKRWLAAHVPQEGQGKRRQWTEDEEALPSEVAKQTRAPANTTDPPALDHITAVLRKHGDSLLRTFIYPDSRAHFLELLGHAGLLPELNVGLGIGWSASEVDFWSYASGMGELREDGTRGGDITISIQESREADEISADE